jgi:1,4-alpha-glucan branching enzyme
MEGGAGMVERIAKRRVDFEYYSPEAKSVFLAGTFNGWNTAANPMKRNKEGRWSTFVNLYPGFYEYQFVVDGAWRDDPACKKRHLNKYGGYNSVLVVE